jgi:neutral ceramidase
VSFHWLDVNASKIYFHEPLVRVEKKQDNQWLELSVGNEPISDDGYDIEVRLLESEKEGMATYETRWYNPVSGGEYRFVIAPRGGQMELHSPVFTWQKGQGVVVVSK